VPVRASPCPVRREELSHNLYGRADVDTSQCERLWLSAAQASGILEIEASKKAVAALETALEAATNRRAAALASHDEVVSQHASTQQQLTSLMQRRESWDSVDVTRFTELTAKEHALKGGISAALHERSEAEVEAERAQRSYLRAMQDKYAAEILLGEKNKLLSTGVWLALLACNTTIFVGTQAGRGSPRPERASGGPRPSPSFFSGPAPAERGAPR